MAGSSIDLMDGGGMHISTSDVYPYTTPTHTKILGQSQHAMLLFPHAYIHAQSLVTVSSSCLFFSVLPFVACGSEGGWVVTLTQICHIASQHHFNHFNSHTKRLISSVHTYTTYFFHWITFELKSTTRLGMCLLRGCTTSASMSSGTDWAPRQLQTVIMFHWYHQRNSVFIQIR